MPRSDQQQITSRTQVNTAQRQPELTQVVARPVDTTVLPAVDSELAGLVSGLTEFNPKLSRFLETNDRFDAKEAQLTGEARARTSVIDPANVSQLPESMPQGVNPAFREHFDQAYKQVLGQRIGIESTAAVKAEYDKQKLTDGFNVETFLKEQLQKQVGGINDPSIAGEVAKHNIELSRSIREEDNKVKLAQLKESTVGSVNAILDNLVTSAGNDPEKLATSLRDFTTNTKQAWSQYMTRPELAAQVVSKVIAMSVQDKGNPVLFDALDKIKDPTTGMTIADTSGELAIAIANGRKAAEKAQEQRIERDMQPALLKELSGWREQVAQGQLIPLDTLANSIGPGKQFASHEAAAAFDKWQRDQIASTDDLSTTLSWMKNGMGYLATPQQQKAAADYVTTPLVNQIMGLVNDPSKQAELNDVANMFAKVHSESQLTVPNEVLKRFIDGLATSPMDPSGAPTPRFVAAAALYRSLPDSVRSMYFGGEDTNRLFKTYTSEVDAGVDSGTAYKGSYTSISPAAKEQERLITKSPEWATKMSKVVESAVDGMNLTWKDVTPFASNLPSNLSLTNAAAMGEASRFLLTHPNMGEEDVKAHLKTWVQNNFVHDTNTNLLVGIPPEAGQAGAKVITAYQDKLVKQYGADSRPTLVYMGNGNYQIQTLNPIAVRGEISWGKLKTTHAEETQLTDADRTAITAIQQKASQGALSPEDLKNYGPLMSKVRTLGLQDKLPIKAMNDAYDKALRNSLDAIPKLTLGSTSSVLGPVPQSANDRTAQREATVKFLTHNYGSNALTASLITQGEGVVLKASPDPAGGAGNNIGMGYNLNANAVTIKEDFRRAGIPTEAIEDIKAGKKAITQEQAERLLIVTLPRYVEKAKGVIESKYPGMWKKMTPQQQAVVTDVAYQVKDFSKFGPSIDALFSGDQAKIDQAFKVHYKNHKGETIEDTRRNALRANLLKSKLTFEAVALNN